MYLVIYNVNFYTKNKIKVYRASLFKTDPL